jgi:hypothetical protein
MAARERNKEENEGGGGLKGKEEEARGGGICMHGGEAGEGEKEALSG